MFNMMSPKTAECRDYVLLNKTLFNMMYQENITTPPLPLPWGLK